MQECTSRCWSTLPFRSCNALTTPSATLYFSRLMLQYILRQLLLSSLSSTTFRSTNTLSTRQTSTHRTCPGSPKQQLHKRYPDIADTPGGPNTVRAQLVEVLPKSGTLPEQFDNLYRSISDRVAAVIDAKGWYTRY